MNKILVLDNHGLGDVMMALPAIRWLLRESEDEIWIAIKNQQFKELLLGEGCGNNFIFLDKFTQTKFQFAKALLSALLKQFDTIIALFGSRSENVKKLRTIIQAKSIHFGPIWDDSIFFDRSARHKVFLQLEIMADWLKKAPPLGVEKDYKLANIDESVGLELSKNREYLVLIPGCGNIERYKRWPLEEFVDFVNQMNNQYPKIDIIISGNSSEKSLAEYIIKNSGRKRIFNFCGKYSLKQTAGIYLYAKFVLGGDSGGLHLAKAAGGKVIGLFGPTNSALTGPIEPELIIDLKLPNTPWYCYDTHISSKNKTNDPSMDIPAELVLERIIAIGLL